MKTLLDIKRETFPISEPNSLISDLFLSISDIIHKEVGKEPDTSSCTHVQYGTGIETDIDLLKEIILGSLPIPSIWKDHIISMTLDNEEDFYGKYLFSHINMVVYSPREVLNKSDLRDWEIYNSYSDIKWLVEESDEVYRILAMISGEVESLEFKLDNAK